MQESQQSVTRDLFSALHMRDCAIHGRWAVQLLPCTDSVMFVGCISLTVFACFSIIIIDIMIFVSTIVIPIIS